MRGSAREAAGFTLLELMVALAIIAILVGIGVWRVDGLLPRWRTDALVNRFALDLRQAQAIAARTNRAVQLTVELGSSDRCSGPSYSIANTDTEYGYVCVPAEYPGVTISAAGAESASGFGCVYPIPLVANGCTFCSGGTGTLHILPTGEVVREDAHANGDALLFAPAVGGSSHVRGVAVRIGTGAARTQRLIAGTWECP